MSLRSLMSAFAAETAGAGLEALAMDFPRMVLLQSCCPAALFDQMN